MVHVWPQCSIVKMTQCRNGNYVMHELRSKTERDTQACNYERGKTRGLEVCKRTMKRRSGWGQLFCLLSQMFHDRDSQISTHGRSHRCSHESVSQHFCTAAFLPSAYWHCVDDAAHMEAVHSTVYAVSYQLRVCGCSQQDRASATLQFQCFVHTL